MKITLNELKNFVRNVIKEEDEKTPTEKLNDEFRILIENFNNAIGIKKQFNEFLENTDTEKFSNVSGSVNDFLKEFKVLSDKFSNMIRVELKNMSSFSQTIPILKIRLPEILEATLKVFPILKEIYKISKNDELDNFIKKFQYGLLPFKMTIDRMIDLLSEIETVSPQQQNNVPQQQTNTPQQQTNTPQQQGNSPQSGVTENLKNFNNELKNLFFDFEKNYILYKKKYIKDEISEKQFSTEISNYFPPMSRLVSQMENEIPINENSFKISIFEDSDFDNYFASLKKYVNTIDEAVLKGKTANIAESINGIKRILNAFQQDLNIFSR